MVGVGLAEVFDAEIVHTEAELGGASVVAPKAGGVWAWSVTMWSKLIDELLVGKQCSLFQAIHVFSDADVDIAVGCNESVQAVLLADVGGEVLVFEAHVLGVFHG